MIQEDDGGIITSLGIINSKLTFNEFKNTELFNSVNDLVDSENDHIKYTIKNVQIDKHSFIITIYFFDNKLILTNLYYLDDQRDEELTWSDWAIKKELKNKECHDRLLEKWLGRGEVTTDNYVNYKYKWGSVSSGYDPKSACSNITINYYCL
ncbi:hypothetical protein [Chengkuizengella sediminis]|uniref:hypothetical protein n=1 Tax=Chengkuizengella sediminis TaxID=1885917 RepID=UPI00138A5169|nr:hypothetical protein [Chengkuizengella sediminis]NDI37253.1 hypothetical protein [Chengkuizengella sediminis]